MPSGFKQKPLKMPFWTEGHEEAKSRVRDHYRGYQAAHRYIIESTQVALKNLWDEYNKELDNIYEELAERG